jgi:E3 ubiquitin-protein ligase HUWE1
VQGEFMHWVALINHFDAFLEKQSKLASLRFDPADEGKSEGIHVADCLAVLRTTSIILENTANKQLYQSVEVC